MTSCFLQVEDGTIAGCATTKRKLSVDEADSVIAREIKKVRRQGRLVSLERRHKYVSNMIVMTVSTCQERILHKKKGVQGST